MVSSQFFQKQFLTLHDLINYILSRHNLVDALNRQELKLEVALDHVNFRLDPCRKDRVDFGSRHQGSLDESSIDSHDCISIEGHTTKAENIQLFGDIYF